MRQRRQKARRLASTSFPASFGRTIKPRSLSPEQANFKEHFQPYLDFESVGKNANFLISLPQVADCATRPSTPSTFIFSDAITSPSTYPGQ